MGSTKVNPIALAALYLDVVDSEAVVKQNKVLSKKLVKSLKKFCRKNEIEISKEDKDNYSIKVDVSNKKLKKKEKEKKTDKKDKKIDKEKLKEKRKKIIKKLKKMTLGELRDFAKANKIPWYGSKEDIYDRIKKAI
jgi:hypothetical protein